MTDYTYPGGQNSQGINVSHINYLYDRSVDNIKHMVEIAKLQYCASVTDIDHDYAVVDVMTDSTGYNNTVCTADSTSTYCCSGLSGYYVQMLNTSEDIIGYIINCTNCTNNCGTVGGYFCTGNYCMEGYANHSYDVSSDAYNWWCGNTCICAFPYDLSSINEINFNLKYCLIMKTTNQTSGGVCAVVSTGGGWFDPKTFSCYCCTNNVNVLSTSTFCYKFVKQSLSCYDFYCNGACKCQVTISAFPEICTFGCAYSCGTTCSGQYNCSRVFLTMESFCAFGEIESSIILNETQYNNPISSIYLTDEHTGTGTVVYNIIDATTSNCIACNLEPNVLNTLTCCICCHIYEIVQCNDGVSCIKSYALIAGEA